MKMIKLIFNNLTLIISILFFTLVFSMDIYAMDATSGYSYNDFIGEWESDTYLTLYVYHDGSFATVDVGAGNPGIQGTMKVISDNEISVNCKYDVDFDSYFKIKRKDVLQYYFNEQGQLIISYEKESKTDPICFTLVSRKVNKGAIENLPKPKINNIQAKNKKLYVTLTEDESEYFTGYEVKYKIAGKSWNAKIINKDRHKYVLKISGIKKKRYKVKARSFLRVGDNIYYSKWTKIKSYQVFY